MFIASFIFASWKPPNSQIERRARNKISIQAALFAVGSNTLLAGGYGGKGRPCHHAPYDVLQERHVRDVMGVSGFVEVEGSRTVTRIVLNRAAALARHSVKAFQSLLKGEPVRVVLGKT